MNRLNDTENQVNYLQNKISNINNNQQQKSYLNCYNNKESITNTPIDKRFYNYFLNDEKNVYEHRSSSDTSEKNKTPNDQEMMKKFNENKYLR